MKDIFGNETLVKTSSIECDGITQEISKVFDYKFEGSVSTEIEIPTFPKEFSIGVIYGSSGSGKSTIMKNCFSKNEKEYIWDNSKCIASNFSTYDEAIDKFGAVGLNSIPTWLKPYNVLSTGEKFRADMAIMLGDNACIDEFTSVVNREVAISCSTSIEKYIRKKNLKNVVFCTCHDDVIPYLQPDWVYNTDTHEFFNGRYLRRPKVSIEFFPCSYKTWDLFKKHHYLSGDLNNSSVCYLGCYNDMPVVFISLIAMPGRDVVHAWREHRLVVLPDFQGMGIGNKTSELFGQLYIEKGCRYFCKTSNPRIGEHREKSSLWRGTQNNRTQRLSYLDKNGNPRKTFYEGWSVHPELVEYHAHRVCYCHEYIGDGKKYKYTLHEDNVCDDGLSQLNLFDVYHI